MSKLIGTNPNQVPSNADLGTAAFMDKKDFLLSKGSSLSAIDAVIPNTATDVFIYDTSKDSDGGAWRNRTQHTSWYNERLNTTTRGSRREFPAVAVIVATGPKVTIYDGDDTSLPMWMIFTNTDTSYSTGSMLHVDTDTNNVYAINGQLVGGSSHINQRGGEIVNFIKDSSYKFNASSAGSGSYRGNIAERNSGKGWTADGELLIVNGVINDIAMTVLPNAPIDPATGLPVPTIALATDAGVSVVKDDGSIIDLTRSTSGIQRVEFEGTRLHINSSTVGGHWIYDNIPNSDSALSPTDGHFEYWDPNFSNLKNPAYLGWSSPSIAANYIGTQPANGNSLRFGLTSFDFDKSNYRNSLISFITSTYNTGWMNGDIKLATLSDTDATDITGSELVTNGTFDSDTSGWTITGTGASFAVVSGQLVITRDGTSAVARQTITTVVGKTYVFSCDLTATSGGALIGLEIGGEGGVISSDLKTHTVTHVATSTSTIIEINTYNTVTGTLTVDNASVRLAEEDRSINDNGLQVFGTVKKTPVAAGADLVAYSGFSNINYLKQPYNSAMDIDASDDVCVITWAKLSAGNSYIFDRIDDAGTGSRYFAYRRGNTDDKLVFMGVTSSAFSDAFATEWHQYTLLRRSGVVEIWVDGVLDTTGADTQDRTNTSAKLTLGNNYATGVNNGANALALFRFSSTAPSPEQIKKIYEDEKVLFQENAKATLYGTSDAVTALAYDDDTNLLHAGTSAGRSVFQGLRRVDNTTRAVGTAISAVDGFVVEE